METNIKKIAKAIKIPVKQWPGNCHTIANEILLAGLVEGKLRYGHWHGFIHPKSQFGSRKFTHHGWIQNGDQIIDPTRWVFENVEPYIYVGPAKDEDYDFGGNRLRKMLMKPAPPFNEKTKTFVLPNAIKDCVNLWIGDKRNDVSIEQVMWLANLPLDILQEKALSVFSWIASDLKIPGFIPYDNRVEILGK